MRLSKVLICLSMYLAIALVSMANRRAAVANIGDNYEMSKEQCETLNRQDPDNSILVSTESANTSGMNRVILKPIEEKKSAKYQLKQEMFNKRVNGKSVPNVNTIFVLQEDFELVENINIPKDCILKFEGGLLRGSYTLTGNNTSIEAGLVQIFDTNIVLSGKWNVIDLYPEWFGAIGNGIADDYKALQQAIKMASTSNTGIYSVKLVNTKTYSVSKHIDIPPRIILSSTFSNRDKSYDGRNKPKIVITKNDDAIHFVTEKGLGNSLGFIVLNNIALIGASPVSNKGIACEDKDAKYIEKCRFNGLYISNFKYGIYVEGDEYVLNGNVIDDLSIQKNVGLCIFVHTKDIYDLIIDNTQLYQPYIGGVRVETHNITTPVTFRNCVMEGCGREYNLDDYNHYGCFAISINSNSNLESVNIDKCYFEANAPVKKTGKTSTISKRESKTFDKTEMYVSNPDWDKTADILINGPQVTITGSVFSVLYQMIEINNAGKLVFNNNVIYVPEGWKKYNMFTKNIVRVKDNRFGCRDISISINMENLTRQFLAKNGIDKLNDIQLATETVPSYISTSVNIPAMSKSYYYTNTTEGIHRTPTLYYDSNALDNGIGTPFAPFKYFDTLLKHASSVFKNGESVSVKLLSNLTIASDISVPVGMNYIFESDKGAKEVKLRKSMNFYNSRIHFNNIKLVKDGGSTSSSKGGTLSLNACNIDFKNCAVELNAYSELLTSVGDCKAFFDGCSIKPHDGRKHYLVDTTNSNIGVILLGETFVGPNVIY